jgi:Kef-type K+ transport system membrane component KefB
MTFTTLALIVAVGLVGPLFAARRSWRVPVVIGELFAGVIIGKTVLNWIDPEDATLTFLADTGFGLTMLVIGSQIPVRDREVRAVLGRGLLGAIAVGVFGAGLGTLISLWFGTDHAALYGVLLSSSSAALVLPILQSMSIDQSKVAQLIAQIAIADIACVAALPLVIVPSRAPVAALGAIAIGAFAVALTLAVRFAGRRGWTRRLHRFSESREFALEMRISVLILCLLAAIAQATHVSVMLAGFALGVVLAMIGKPRRLARQLFGVTEGFLGPLFFVWLGASIDLGELVEHPDKILLGATLATGAVGAHLAARAVGLPWMQAVASSGQLGVPLAAVALGIETSSLAPGEGAGILLGSLLTVAVSAVAAGRVRIPVPR